MIHSIIFSFLISELEINLVNIKLKNDLRWFSEFFFTSDKPMRNNIWRRLTKKKVESNSVFLVNDGRMNWYRENWCRFSKGKFCLAIDPLFMKLSCSSKKIWRVSVIDKFTVFSINEKNLFNYWLKFSETGGINFC